MDPILNTTERYFQIFDIEDGVSELQLPLNFLVHVQIETVLRGR
jgi:hypothetical protein